MSPGVERLFGYARERYNIHLRRLDGEPPPWTEDLILRQYRFCNIFREDDRVTRWMREHLTRPLGADASKQLRAAIVFRWFNKIETGELLRDLLVGAWDTEVARDRLKARVAEGQTILGAAYMIKSLIGVNKVDGLLDSIDQVNKDIPDLAADAVHHQSLEQLHTALIGYPYLGPFMAYEMVTDVRHSPLLFNARDTHSWASAGPGAARGICRVLGIPLGSLTHNSPADRAAMNTHMRDILMLAGSMPDLWPGNWPAWEMREVEHTLCEWDKYERARLGEGRPKQLFKPIA